MATVLEWGAGVEEQKRRRAEERLRAAKAERDFQNLRELADASEQLAAALDQLAAWIAK